MKTTALSHRHGGKITALNAIEHVTPKGRGKRASWWFIGTVLWDDGSLSEAVEISPICVCAEDPPNNPEIAEAMGKLHEYLMQHGEWIGSEWIPQAKAFRQAI